MHIAYHAMMNLNRKILESTISVEKWKNKIYYLLVDNGKAFDNFFFFIFSCDILQTVFV